MDGIDWNLPELRWWRPKVSDEHHWPIQVETVAALRRYIAERCRKEGRLRLDRDVGVWV